MSRAAAPPCARPPARAMRHSLGLPTVPLVCPCVPTALRPSYPSTECPSHTPAAQAADKRLVAQPLALRALQRAGMSDERWSSPGGLTSLLSDPSLVSHLCSSLAAAADEPIGERPPPFQPPPAASRHPLASERGMAAADSTRTALGLSASLPSSSADAYGGDTLPQLLALVAHQELYASNPLASKHLARSVEPRVVKGRQG